MSYENCVCMFLLKYSVPLNQNLMPLSNTKIRSGKSSTYLQDQYTPNLFLNISIGQVERDTKDVPESMSPQHGTISNGIKILNTTIIDSLIPQVYLMYSDCPQVISSHLEELKCITRIYEVLSNTTQYQFTTIIIILVGEIEREILNISLSFLFLFKIYLIFNVLNETSILNYCLFSSTQAQDPIEFH